MRGETLQELIAWTPPYQQYIMDKGLLLPQTKMIMFGKFQTWKSMIVIHTAFCIATGKEWFGFKTIQSTCYTIQVEIPKPQFRSRVIKYATGNQITTDNIYFSTEHYIKLDRAFGCAELEKEIQRTHPQVVIIDPIYKVVSGRMTDEYDMRQFMDRMDELMSKYKFALLLIHHDRKQILSDGVAVSYGAEDMFGTSIFIDWCDTSIRTATTSVDGDIVLTFEKVRHAEEELKPMVIHVNRKDLTFVRKSGGKATFGEVEDVS